MCLCMYIYIYFYIYFFVNYIFLFILCSIVGASQVLCKNEGEWNMQSDYWLCGLGGKIFYMTTQKALCIFRVMITSSP